MGNKPALTGNCKKVLDELKARQDAIVNGITANQARDSLGVERLAARIHDLREMGYDISSITVTEENNKGMKRPVSLYFLNKSEGQN
ncbi:helix-turn-helix domain-containing protein [Nitrospirillum amazonense]|uniref:helix-turn-helix domain-containing protein n=1 Tax=Nitrospirillum amazonense TaxID=28077 RepID=UPI002DD421AD|nr:helix-turn-helix domain-containing protein [Nitrospirillum amazonense]MEC4590570.1 helix-turn-helix domain-containing protein [Nitrospirillum amazonense]